MTRITLAALAGAALLAVPALAGDDEQAPRITVGDDAPPLEISHWLKGEPIEAFEPGKVYVVEFWATWCGPCRMSMPHLSELQEKYRDYDVTVVGISDEPLQTVVDFLFKTDKIDGKVENDRTHYTLTTDPDRSVMNSYHKAAGQRGIPCAFIVGKDSKIEWIGHPYTMDDALDAVVRDDWDRAAFKVKFETDRANREKAEKIAAEVQKALRDGDHAAALKAMDRLIALGDQYTSRQVDKMEILARDMGNYEEAWTVGGQAVDDLWDDPMQLNRLAWFIADQEGLKQRDLELAMKAANRANELTEGKDAAILDTVARVYYEQGHLEKALIYERKAVKHAPEGPMLEDLKKTLDKYESESDR